MDEEASFENLWKSGCVVTFGFLCAAGGSMLALRGSRPSLDIAGSLLAVFGGYFLLIGLIRYQRLARLAIREWREKRAVMKGLVAEDPGAEPMIRLREDKGRIRNHFKYSDPTIFRWRLSISDSSEDLPRGSLEGPGVAVLLFVFLGTIFAVTGHYVYWFLGEWTSHKVSFWFAAVQAFAMLGAIVILYVASRHGRFLDFPLNTQYMRKLIFPMFALGSILYLLNSPAGYIRSGFVGVDGTGIGQWGLFFLDNILDILTLDILDVYDLHLSSITPISFWARLMTVIVKVVVLGFLVDVFLQNIKAAGKDRVFYGTTAECAVEVNHDIGMLQEVTKEGRVMLYKRKVSANADAFGEAFEGYMYR